MDTFKIARVSMPLLRSFEAAARHLSFTRAAAELGRSQATLSLQVRELERQLDVQLLSRTTRSVTLTEAGEALVRDLSTGLETIEAGLTAARNLGKSRHGRVAVACVPSLSAVRLPQILAGFRNKDATSQIDIEELTYVEMVEALGQGRVDFGVGPCVDPSPPTISFSMAAEDRLCVLLPATHENAGAAAAPLRSLEGMPLIFLRGTATLQASLRSAAKAHAVELSSRSTVRQAATAIGMVRAGLGAAILPRLALPDTIDADLAVLPIVDPPMIRRTGILTYRGRKLEPVAARLSRFVSAALASAGRSFCGDVANDTPVP